ncbi:MAG: hypothetical protein K6G56_05080 [Clostridiales bacterium]|nr:hypothetical protein [Clostridiales bacterium]
MKLKEWFRIKKEKRAARRQAKLERKLGIAHEEPVSEGPVPEELIPEEIVPEDVIPEEHDRASEGEMPASRFTEEYREFLKKQEAVKASEQNVPEES